MLHQDFAAFLRRARRQRKLTQGALARRAQISERALRYWEAGQASPGQWELDSILTALELSLLERANALALIPTRRGIKLSRQAAVEQALERGPQPALGDLLQAMRLRRGLTQGQVAEALKISHSTLSRWEATDTLPSQENIERICTLLHAFPEERAVLMNRRQPMGSGKPHLSLQECAEQVEALDQQVVGVLSPLIDLHALTLKRQLWLRAGENEAEAVRLLARVHLTHSNYLSLQNRKTELETCLQSTLDLLRGRQATELFWGSVVNLASQSASEGRRGAAAGVELIRRWLPTFPQKAQATLWCDMALHAGRSHQHELAAAYLSTARHIIQLSPHEQGLTEHYYPLTNARIQLHAKRPVEAMKWLPPVPDETCPAAPRASYLLLWTEAFLEAGEKDAAQRHIDQLAVLFANYPQPRFEVKLAKLAARI